MNKICKNIVRAALSGVCGLLAAGEAPAARQGSASAQDPMPAILAAMPPRVSARYNELQATPPAARAAARAKAPGKAPVAQVVVPYRTPAQNGSSGWMEKRLQRELSAPPNERELQARQENEQFQKALSQAAPQERVRMMEAHRKNAQRKSPASAFGRPKQATDKNQ